MHIPASGVDLLAAIRTTVSARVCVDQQVTATRPGVVGQTAAVYYRADVSAPAA